MREHEIETLQQINELKHRALLLQIGADERARGLAARLGGVDPGYEVRDIHLDNIAKFAAAVVAFLEPMVPGSAPDASTDRSGNQEDEG